MVLLQEWQGVVVLLLSVKAAQRLLRYLLMV
jgi:hypothetical protein